MWTARRIDCDSCINTAVCVSELLGFFFLFPPFFRDGVYCCLAIPCFKAVLFLSFN
jgi:hypothetical protein